MAKEIERKYLVIGNDWRRLGKPTLYRQGYLAKTEDCIVRVRLEGEKGKLTIKGWPRGIVRDEFEYEIPAKDASAMLDAIGKEHQVIKNRTKIPYKGKTWEVDEFFGENEGLIVAEIELKSEDEPFEAPAWVGRDVSLDPRYYNISLMLHPYKEWTKEEKSH